jgi:hypothetical protein
VEFFLNHWWLDAAGAILIVFALLGAAFWLQKFEKISTIEDYKQRNPDCVKNRRVSCNSCGGNSVYLRVIGQRIGHVLNAHVCRQCGAELYRSRTPTG